MTALATHTTRTQEFLTAKPRVLVVDNEPMSCTLLDAVLRTDNHYEVLTAHDSEQGLEIARRARPDLMLLSATMAGADDGFSVCRILKSEPRTRRIPLILVTSQAAAQERALGMEAGADDFLCKPFNRIELLARVRSLLRIKALNDHLDEMEDIIHVLSRAVEAREGDGCEAQTERVTVYACGLGREIGLSEESVRVLQQAAMLRDIGKIGLPDNILEKCGPLDEDEHKNMQRHTLLGEQIISPLRPRAEALLPIIRHHHERIDGKGYPDGLVGDLIPLGARIIAIADSYAAMTSPRPYRAALSPAKAFATLQAGAGRQWDQHLVGRFIVWAQNQSPSHLLT